MPQGFGGRRENPSLHKAIAIARRRRRRPQNMLHPAFVEHKKCQAYSGFLSKTGPQASSHSPMMWIKNSVIIWVVFLKWTYHHVSKKEALLVIGRRRAHTEGASLWKKNFPIFIILVAAFKHTKTFPTRCHSRPRQTITEFLTKLSA